MQHMLNTTTNNYPHILTLNNAQRREGKAATRMLMKGHAESAVQKSREPKVEGGPEKGMLAACGQVREGEAVAFLS